MANTSIAEELFLLVKSRHAVVYFESVDEEFAMNQISSAVDRLRAACFVWSVSQGLQILGKENKFYKTEDPLVMIKSVQNLIEAVSGAAVFVLKDFHKYVEDPVILRVLKDAMAACRGKEVGLIVLAAEYKWPSELEADTARIVGGYPDASELGKLLDDVLGELRRIDPVIDMELSSTERERVLGLFKGLSGKQIRSLVGRCVADDYMLDIKDLRTIEKFKKEVFDQSGILEYCAPEDMEGVAGFMNLKRWVAERRVAFQGKAHPGLPPPKGILLMGVQGCGKSLAVKAVAQVLGLPLYRLDMGRLYSKFIGETEENLRKALRTVDKLSPICLWLDELEKGFAVSDSSSDGGVSQRVFGTFLTWMQEREAPCFIAATANDVFKLPPEFLRKGRFDEIFFVDLPDEQERRRILRIHMEKRGIAADGFDMDVLGRASAGFSGSEIEQAIISALYRASGAGRPIATGDVSEQMGSTKPLSVLRQEDIARLRQWCAGRAAPV